MKSYYVQYVRLEESSKNSRLITLTHSFSSQPSPSTKLLHQIQTGLAVRITAQGSYQVPLGVYIYNCPKVIPLALP